MLGVSFHPGVNGIRIKFVKSSTLDLLSGAGLNLAQFPENSL